MTDETKNLIKFAVRTILIYGQNSKKYQKYEFTLLSGAVLNVLSAVFNGRMVDSELRNKLVENFPHLEPRKSGELKKSIQQLIGALSAKTENYHIEKDHRQIAYIEVRSQSQNVSKKYTFGDLEQILKCFTAAILSHDEYKGIYDSEKAEFDRHYPEGALQ